MEKLWKIIRFTSELWRLYASLAIFTVFVGALGLVRPIVFGKIVDIIATGLRTGSVGLSMLIVPGIVLFVVDLLTNIVGNVSGYFGDITAQKLKRILSERYYEKLLSLPQAYYDKELTGTIVNRLTRGIDSITRFIQMMSNNFISMFLTILFSIIYISFKSWIVSILILLLIPLYFMLTRKTSTKWQEFEREINTELDKASGRFSESVSQIKVVKSFIQERREKKYFHERYGNVRTLAKKQSALWHREDTKRKLLLNTLFFSMVAALIWQVSRGSLSPGQFTTFIFMINTLTFPIANMGFIVENAQRAITGSTDFFDVIERPAEINDAPGAKSLKVEQAAIRFDDVTFGYEENRAVLNHINFAIEPATKVALVGESGEGKTTIANLLLRLYEPSEGSISIDGTAINTVTQDSLRKQIGVVFQDPALFSGTIYENIAYANPKATNDMVIAAAKAANAHEFIEKFEKSYASEIGERGVKLSGGQKQRIAIARAILKDAPILILDEATSSLDNKSELLVQEALERLMHNRTTIIIAHRLSTIQNVDKIITIKQGAVDETGSPKQLARTGGIYAQLLALQERRDREQARESLKKFDIAA